MSGQIFGPLGVLPTGGGGGGVTFSYIANGTTGGGTGVGITLGAGITTVSSDIVVIVISNEAAAPTSVTIGGNSMIAVSGAADASGVDFLSMWYFSGTPLSGATSIVVNSGGTMQNVGAQAGVISGSATPTPASGAAIAASFSDPFTTGAVTVPTGGIMIVHGSLSDPNVFSSPSNWTMDNTMLRGGGGGRNEHFGHTALGTGATITATSVTAANQNHGIRGVWSA